MKQLTREQELTLINQYATYNNFIDNGSSRAVFDIDDNTVVKVALCPQGVKQIEIEVESYRKYGSSGYLADIIYYGKYVIVAERIQPLELDLDYLDQEALDGYHLQIEDYYAVLDAANDWFGDTADNNQVGLTQNHKLKMFDYGYDSYNYDMYDLAGNLGEPFAIYDYIKYIPFYFEDENIYEYKSFNDYILESTNENK